MYVCMYVWNVQRLSISLEENMLFILVDFEFKLDRTKVA